MGDCQFKYLTAIVVTSFRYSVCSCENLSNYRNCSNGVIECKCAYFVPRNTTKLTTRGGTSSDGMEMTLIRERKSTHRLRTRLSTCQVRDLAIRFLRPSSVSSA